MNKVTYIDSQETKASPNKMMRVLRRFRYTLPRTYYRTLCMLLFCMVAAFACNYLLFTPSSRRVKRLSPQDQEADWFIAIGKSKQYPRQWERGKKDPFYNLTLVGDEKSPGQDGAKVVHSPKDTSEVKRRWGENYFDIVASEKIPLDRRVKDLRHQDCMALRYDEKLPSVSVIIIFYNEAPSVLLRTIVSVLNRSPTKYVKEIILVDDHSSIPTIKDTLPKAVEALFPPLVKLTRNPTRLGLIKARMAGSDKAQGDVILFLDSHCEVGPGWLEPLLQRIKQDYRNVVMPSHDIVEKEGFEFVGSSTVDNQGTFNWGMLHTWQSLPDYDRLAIKTKADPVRSPTMAGGLFAISRKWWEHLGKYDPGFEVWGGENVEISFKTWMCGGRLDIIPCSHVGHVFRGGSPYPGHVKNSMSINQKRLAEVWLDDFKHIVYLRHPELRELDAGDVSSRIALRKRLNCHSFEWYMVNVVPDKYIPSTRIKAGDGLITFDNQCVDTLQKESGTAMIYESCHYTGSQNFQLTSGDQIRNGVDTCLEASTQDMRVIMVPCSDASLQKWTHRGPNEQIQLMKHDTFCIGYTLEKKEVILQVCNSGDQTQLWKFKTYYEGEEQI